MPTIKPAKIASIRRLFWDIETSPNLVFTWRIGHNLSIGHDSIVAERKIICIAYKWENERDTVVLRWDSDKDDRSMLKQFLAVANEADELVAHYGDGFDMPWFRARCLIHGLEPLPLYKTVDTKAWASKYFYFNSNKLDYLGKIFGFGGKLETKYQLWLDVMNGSKAALDYMCRYCGKDVIRLQQVWNKLRFCVRPKTHVGVHNGGEKWTCAHCGSSNVSVSKRRVTASGTVSYQMRCNDCGGYFTISQKSYDAYRKAKRLPKI